LASSTPRPETAVDLLYDRVLPFYESHGLTIEAILTDNGPEYKGRPSPDQWLVEGFNLTILDEFFRKAFREKFYQSVEALQEDLDWWLLYYHQERPHRGYCNMGRRPLETFQLGKARKEDLNAA